LGEGRGPGVSLLAAKAPLPAEPRLTSFAALTAEQQLGWLTLLLAPGFGVRRGERLLAAYPDPADWPSLPARALAAAGLPAGAALAHADHPALLRTRAWLEQPGNALLLQTDPAYPPALKASARAPLALFVRGDARTLADPALAIVGSRHPSASGRENAYAFAAALAQAGLSIVSGLAIGCDAAAHEGALSVSGTTVAVLAGGVDNPYPARNRGLAERIVTQGGALISEQPPGTPIRRELFPQRNRIVSGLCLGVLVIEAGLDSGSLITARLAAEQGREVFALPGSIHNPQARGCHALIREGARLTETTADILSELAAPLRRALHPGRNHALQGPVPLPEGGNLPPQPQAEAPPGLDAAALKLWQALDYDPASVDVLVERSGLTPGEVSSILIFMELQGHLARAADGRYERRSPRFLTTPDPLP